MRLVKVVAICLLAAAPCRAGASAADEVRSTFERFVAAQNAHDARAVGELLLDSPDLLWITRGTAIWGRGAALERFASLYQGTWRLEPEAGALRVVVVAEGVAQLFVPILFTAGPAGQPPVQTRFLMNQVLVRTAAGWKVSSILPIPAPAQ